MQIRMQVWKISYRERQRRQIYLSNIWKYNC